MSSKQEVVVLFSWGGEPLATFSSEEKLAKGVDYWIKENKRILDSFSKRNLKSFKLTMTYKWFQLDYMYEPLSWGYAYIPKSEYKQIRALGIKGGVDPEDFLEYYPADKNLVQYSLDKKRE